MSTQPLKYSKKDFFHQIICIPNILYNFYKPFK